MRDLRRLVLFCLLCFFLGLNARNPLQPSFYAASEYPPLVPQDMKRPGFWIARHPNPDSLIMNAATLTKFNQNVIRKGHVSQIIEHSRIIQGSNVRTMITQAYNQARALGLYDATGTKVSQTWWQEVRNNTNMNKIPAVPQVRFGFPIRFTDQRLVPSSENLNQKVLDREFDELQNSGFDIDSPTVFYHTSADGKWYFGASNVCVGWYRAEDVVVLPHAKWIEYQKSPLWVISTSAKNDIYQDSLATRYHCFVRMGVKLPLIAEHEDYYQVQIPAADTKYGYISKTDAVVGYLPYTARNIYLQAFKLLNIPYGWGDMGGEYDCSGLIKQLFACFGIYLPRNGTTQSKAGKLIVELSDKKSLSEREAEIVKKGVPAITLLRMPGHIMLYLGSVDGKAYALHDTWGFRTPNNGKDDDINVINKTVVSELHLGEGSKKGSLLKRLTTLSKLLY